MAEVVVEGVLRRLGIEAKRQGREWIALCPNPDHDDKSPSWRIRDQPGDRRHGMHHCFAAETMVVTRGGVRAIGELRGLIAEVLTLDAKGIPRWVLAPVSSFGVQELWTVVLSRNGVKKEIRTTAGHRWFVRSNARWIERTTESLIVGHRLRPASLPRSGTIAVSPWGAAHGVVFGDGTLYPTGSRVSLWGEKDAPLRRLFPLSPTRSAKTPNGVKGILVLSLPRFFKRLPDLEESPSYLYGWLAGFFAADGSVTERGMPLLASADKGVLRFVERLCIRLGIFTYGIRRQERVGYGKLASSLFTLPFRRSSLSSEFFLINAHRKRWTANREVKERAGWVVESVERSGESEEVFCASVPETHNFALDGYIVTGNCWPCGFGGTIGDLVQKVLGIDWREAKDWLGSDTAVDRPVAASVELKQRPWDSTFHLPVGVDVDVPLEKWPGSARKYLFERGILPEQVERWGIGFSVEGRLRGRLVFVKRDPDGKPVGYSARTFIGGFRRYLEPESWEGASPASIYGEQHWPFLPDERTAVCVVEGAINGLAIERAIPGASFAATSGSQLNVLVAAKLASFREVVVVTDPDEAGDKLAGTISDALARHQKIFRRVRLAAGEDAASVASTVLKEAVGW